MDNVTLQDALAKKTALAEQLAQADAEVKDLARQQYEAALEACRVAGVSVAVARKRGPRAPEVRLRQSEAMRAVWANKSPEARAEWQARLIAGRRSVQ